MKKFFVFLAAAAAAVTSFVFTSCDDNENVSPIIGTWQYDKDASSIEFDEESSNNNIFGESVTFNEDGTFTATDISGTYTLNGHDFAFSYKKGEKTYSIKKGADIFDVVAEKASEKETLGKIDGMATVTVDDCKANFNNENKQLIVTLTITKAIELEENYSDDELSFLKNIIESFKGQSTQTLIFNKK